MSDLFLASLAFSQLCIPLQSRFYSPLLLGVSRDVVEGFCTLLAPRSLAFTEVLFKHLAPTNLSVPDLRGWEI